MNPENKTESTPILLDSFDQAKGYADKLIKEHHPHLATANITFLCRNRASKSQGKPVPGSVKRASLVEKHLSGSECDYIMTLSLDVWNSLTSSQRLALVDHLLTRCVGTEDERNGSMKWSLRSPEVQEFAEVVSRNGLWNESIADFIDSAK